MRGWNWIINSEISLKKNDRMRYIEGKRIDFVKKIMDDQNFLIPASYPSIVENLLNIRRTDLLFKRIPGSILLLGSQMMQQGCFVIT
jgi:hypothetical protein